MKQNTIAIAAMAALALTGTAHSQVLTISDGALEGQTAAGVTTFKGIPFAAPPVGMNRWREPQPVNPWAGVRDASQFGADCAQVSFGEPGNSPKTSEDCLFLNIWRPSETSAGEKLPVMVWIYGGAFVFGSGAQPSYDGAAFARRGVILVTLNYRLGRFGFFAHPALSAEHPEEPHGNYAFMDQIAALKWVQQNISTFGGDPNNVTIFGESAGGVSVHNLIVAPMAHGLFQKAIIESGGGRDGTLTARPLRHDNTDPNYPISAETIGRNFAVRYGITGDDGAALNKLRALTAAEIIDNGQDTAGPGGPKTYSGPILDGLLVVETAQSAYTAGRQPKIPLIIGSNSAEIPAGFVAGTTKEEVFDGFGKGKAAAIEAYDPQGTTTLATLLTQVNTDRVWAEPSRFTARAFAQKGAPAYLYRFSYVASRLSERLPAGAPHASEIDYVFDNVAARYGATLTPRDQSVAHLMNSYWANFAKTGDPNGAGLPVWPMFTVTENDIIDILPDGTAKGGADVNRAKIDATELSGGQVISR